MKYTLHPKFLLRTSIKSQKFEFTKSDLVELYSKRNIQEALYLASPILLGKCQKWLDGNIIDEKEEKKIILSLTKYALRMHNRTTPFGLFAGCATIDSIADNIYLDENNINRKTRFDMNVIFAMANSLLKIGSIKENINYFPNSSLYFIHNKIRYIDYRYYRNRRMYQISEIEKTDYLIEIIELAEKGASYKQLVSLLKKFEVSKQEAIEFIDELIENQVLSNELEPSLTGGDPLDQLIDVLKKIENKGSKSLENVLSTLIECKTKIELLDKNKENELEKYEEIKSLLSQLGVDPDTDNLFQTDLFFVPEIKESEHKKEIEKEFENAMFSALEILNRLNIDYENQNLKKFANDFYERYEEREVPLVEALDNETGVGYASNNNETGDINPLIENFYFGKAKRNSVQQINVNDKHWFLNKKLLDAFKNDLYEIEITNKDVEKFEVNWENMPESFFIMFKQYVVNEKKRLYGIDLAGGTSANNLIGRFATGSSEVREIFEDITLHEENALEGKIVATIIHMPENKTGNILQRTNARKFEIPYLSRSGIRSNQQIKLDDLLVSIKNDQIILRSSKFNKEVVPRMDTAHNYEYNSLPIYHFLCDLQQKDKIRGLYFDWGVFSNLFNFLPRVVTGNVVLSRATWKFTRLDISENTNSNNPKQQLIEFLRKNKVPNNFILVDDDNFLPINVENEISLDVFFKEIKKMNSIIIKENLAQKTESIIKDKKNNSYPNEFITFLLKDKEKSLNEEIKKNQNNNGIERNFMLGSEWLYLKIYLGLKSSDFLLKSIIDPFVNSLIKEKVISKWFFIRYADPTLHIRIRFCVLEPQNIPVIYSKLEELLKEYVNSGLIWDISTDIYKRELERYGHNTMEISENIFYLDSISTLDFLNFFEEDEELEINRWKFSLKKMDAILDIFKLDIIQKIKFSEQMKNIFAQEFNSGKIQNIQIDKKYRSLKKNIEDIFTNDFFEKEKYLEMNKNFESWRIKMQIEVDKILDIKMQKKLVVDFEYLISSYIHMFVNRLFKSKQRKNEYILYELLNKYYVSFYARLKKQNDKKIS